MSMADVFISYSRKDKVFARRLFDQLKQENFTSWIDWAKIPYGSEWLDEILEGIEGSDNFIFIISPDSLTSEICHIEIEHARKKNKRIIPVVRREVEEKYLGGEWFNNSWRHIAEENYTKLRTLNYMFFRKLDGFNCNYDEVTGEVTNPECDSKESDADDFETAFTKLLETIKTDPEHARFHTRYLLRAQEWESTENKLRKQDNLLIGQDIDEAEAWLSQWQFSRDERAKKDLHPKEPLPLDLHYKYIHASREAETRRTKTLRNIKRVRLLATITAAFAIIFAVVSTLIGFDAVDRANLAEQSRNTADSAQSTSVSERGTAVVQVTQAQELLYAVTPTWSFISTEVQIARDFADSLQLASVGRDIYYNGQNQPLGLRLVLEASEIDNSQQVQNILRELAYQPGMIYRVETGYSSLRSLAVSPDGERFLTGGDIYNATETSPSSLLLWDTSTGEVIREFQTDGHSVPIVSFNQDGDYILAGMRGSVGLWSVTESEIIHTYSGLTGEILTVSMSSDGEVVYAVTSNLIIFWDLDSGDILRQISLDSDYFLASAESPDGLAIITVTCKESYATFCLESTLELRNVDNGEIFRSLESVSEHVSTLEFSPDGHTVVAGIDAGIILWDVNSGAIQRQFTGHADYVNSLAFDQTGTYLISGSTDGSIILWEIADGTIVRKFEGNADTGLFGQAVQNVSFVPDTQLIISGSADESISVWTLSRYDLIDDLEISNEAIWGMDLDPTGRFILAASGDNLLTLLDINTREMITVLEGHSDDVRDVAFSPNGRRAVSVGLGELVIWDLVDGIPIEKIERSTAFFLDVDYSPDGRYFVTASADQVAIIWDASNGEIVRILDLGGLVSHVVFTSDSQEIIIIVSDRVVKWRTDNGEVVQSIPLNYGNSASLSEDDTYLLVGQSDNTVILLEMATGEVIRTYYGHSSGVQTVTFSPDGQQFVSGSMDGTVILWDVLSGEIFHRYQGHLGSVRSTLFSPDGDSIYSSSDDGTIILWRNPNFSELQQWILDNLYLPDLSCGQRLIYQMTPCNDETPHLEG